VGRYLLIEPLGAGSQAVVWRAAVDATPSREVALKLLATPSSCDHRGVARLRREAGRGRRMHSPAILEVSDFGIADGVAYMAMPLVEGGTLADVLDRRHHRPATGPPPGDAIWLASLPEAEYIPAVARVMARVARALQVAHEAAVVHCDIKPANILLERHRSGGVFLADFGMGRDLDAMGPGQRWDLSGTPRYMAPELLLGRPADGRLCDVYSLGVTMFEAVTGSQPFLPAEDGMPLAERLAQLAVQEPARVRAVAPWVPPQLGAIIERAMAEDPARRYLRASALAEDLDRFLDSLAAGGRTLAASLS
jgi:eukaryotic-like serine/threonine-protein kinase